VRWGLLSTARINDRILAGAAGSESEQVVAVGSRDARRAEDYAREKGLERAHGSYEALLADAEVDAVYVSLPNAEHVPWTVRALEAGKHVLCEKPLTRHPAQAEEAFDAAERTGRVLSEAFMWRHHPQTARLAALVRERAVGELRLVRATFAFALARAGDVRLDVALDGGSLMDVGCYCVSALRLLAGEPERVTGERVLGPGGVDVRFAGAARFPGAVLGLLDCGFDTAPRHEIEVVGSEGTLRVADPWFGREAVIVVRRGEESERVEVEAVDPYRAELEDVARAARDGSRPLLGREDAVGQARALAALHRAAATGRVLTPG
jgi:predicted dehydrogenase